MVEVFSVGIEKDSCLNPVFVNEMLFERGEMEYLVSGVKNV
jgi:hypothetical protein